ncbi:MAG: hypothetical protein ACP5N6_14390 [Anaerolineae bacterium]|jgi:hypothetical protein
MAQVIKRETILQELERLAAPTWPTTQRCITAWLGEPIAIADPTAAYFRRQSGSNLLIVGQNDEAALGMMAVGLISLAAQLPSPVSP